MKKWDEWKEALSYLLLVTQLGIIMVVSIGVGLALGYWLDKVFKTRGILTAVFIIFGVGAGFMNLYKMLMRKFR